VLVRITFALLLPLAWRAAIAAAPPPVADYDGALTSSVAGAPDLSIVGSGTAFVSEQVLSYLPPQNVLTFPAGSAVELTPMSQILPSSGVYTIAVQARITNTSTDGYSKLIDFDNGTTEYGLYDYNGGLVFYYFPVVFMPTKQILANYGDIVLTRDGSGTLSGYYDGALQFTLDDSPNGFGIIHVSDKLRFFLDDTASAGTEQSDGAVARIRIWTDALSAAEVAHLTDPIFIDGFDGT